MTVGPTTAPQYTSAQPSMPVSAPTTMFGGIVPAVHFHLIAVDPVMPIHRPFYPAQLIPKYTPPAVREVLGTSLNTAG